MKPGIALICAASLLVVAPGRAQDAAKDLAALQGTWVIVGKEYRGMKATPEELEGLMGETVIKESTASNWREEMGKKTLVSEVTIKLDPKTTPKSLDISFTTGDLKGQTVPAIYEVAGDMLKVCYAFETDKRPTEFAGKKDGMALFLTYKRVKK